MKQDDRKRETRDRILAAARKLFETRGFDETPIDAIVREADVAKGTFYLHFETKLDVLQALTRSDLAAAMPQIMARLAKSPAARMLRDATGAMNAWFEANRSLSEAFILHGFSKREPSGSRPPSHSSRGLFEAIVAKGQADGDLRRDIPPHRLAEMYASMFATSVLGWCRAADDDDAGPLAPWTDPVIDVFLAGAAPPRRRRAARGAAAGKGRTR